MNDPSILDVNEALDMGWKDMPPSGPSFFRRVMRQAWIVILCVIAAVAVAFGMAVISAPLFTAQVALFLDGEVELQPRGEDATAIDLHTQVELIRSDQTTLAVIEALELDTEPDFMPEPSRLRTLIESLRTDWGLSTPEDETGDSLPAMIEVVRNGLYVERAGNTRIIDLSYTSFSPEDAATFANTYAHVYVRDLSARNKEATSTLIERLTGRAEEMRKNAADADGRIREILNEAGIAVSDPRELERQVADLRDQLSELRAITSSASSQLTLISNYEQSKDLASLPIDTVESRAIVAELYAASSRLEDIQQSDNSTQRTARVEQIIDALDSRLTQEVRRSAMALQIQIRARDAQRTAIEEQIAELNALLSSDAWTEMEGVRRDKEFYDGAYQDYLSRLETVQRTGAPRPDLRIVADALVPAAPSWPRYKVLLVIAATLGFVLGIGIAALREWNRNEPE